MDNPVSGLQWLFCLHARMVVILQKGPLSQMLREINGLKNRTQGGRGANGTGFALAQRNMEMTGPFGTWTASEQKLGNRKVNRSVLGR